MREILTNRLDTDLQIAHAVLLRQIDNLNPGQTLPLTNILDTEQVLPADRTYFSRILKAEATKLNNSGPYNRVVPSPFEKERTQMPYRLRVKDDKITLTPQTFGESIAVYFGL